jgi:DNA-binding transcriptional ArsR family regulator
MRNLDEEILELVGREPVTPDEVAKRLKISWGTANGHLLKLVGEGRVLLVRKGRVNVYRTKGASRLEFKVPGWTKARSLKALSEELVGYFPRNMTAAEMIEKERRNA